MTIVKPNIGRREAIGLGIEATPGVSVAPQNWLRWLTHGVQNKTSVIENESAMGVVSRVNDSEVVQKWAEGTIGGKVTSESIGFLLLGFFGSCSTGAVSSGIYPHTFSENQSSEPKTLTIARNAPLGAQRHAYGTFDNLEITAEAGGWVEMSTAVKAWAGVASNETPAFLTTEKEFTSKHITLKVANDVASLAGATPIKVSRVSMVMERSSEAFFPLGSDSQPEFDRGASDYKGEFVMRLTDDQYETDFLANAIKALRITIANGTTSLELTAGRVRYREMETTRDRDNIVTVTVQYYCEFSPSENASVTPLLKNTRAAYVAA